MKTSLQEPALILILSAVLLLASWCRWAPIDFTEACGFVTGAVCVWLVTRGSPEERMGMAVSAVGSLLE